MRTSPGANSPCTRVLCTRPRLASRARGRPPELGPRLCAGSGRPPERPPREGCTQPPCAGTACPAEWDPGAPGPEAGYEVRSLGGAASSAPAEPRGEGQRLAECALPRGLASGTRGARAVPRGAGYVTYGGAASPLPAPSSRRAVGRGVHTSPPLPGPARPPQPGRAGPGAGERPGKAFPGAWMCGGSLSRPSRLGSGRRRRSPRVYCSGAARPAPGSAAGSGLRRQNRLQLCISGLFFFFPFFLLFNSRTRNSA